MPRLFRSMKVDAEGQPQLEMSARGLGARPGIDVQATDIAEIVPSGQGGVSVSPGDPMNLPTHRRPPELQGVGRDPVWWIDEADLPSTLVCRPDPRQPGHAFLEPAEDMTLSEYQLALAATQGLWHKLEREDTDDDV